LFLRAEEYLELRAPSLNETALISSLPRQH
jgi:hypothetical protein